MFITVDTVTVSQINDYARAARDAGDSEAVALCERAVINGTTYLSDDMDAREAVVEMINAVEAIVDDE